MGCSPYQKRHLSNQRGVRGSDRVGANAIFISVVPLC